MVLYYFIYGIVCYWLVLRNEIVRFQVWGGNAVLWILCLNEKTACFITCRATLALVLFVASWSSRIVFHTEQVSA